MSVFELICTRFSFSPTELRTYVRTCPYRYKTYPISKRNSREKRWISQPSKDLKAVQRLVLSEFLVPKLIVHDSAKAYKIDTNILDNAKPHLQNQFLLKMDFRNFFPSIQAQDFLKHLTEKNIVQNKDEAALLALIFFKRQDDKLVLSIGSPGSPIISNALMFSFDKMVSEICGKYGVTYTRYSDDITFSTKQRGLLFTWPEKIEAVLAKIQTPKLEVNPKKTVFSSKKFNRHVTGITISNEGLASIGHTKKRALRSRVHNVSNLTEKEVASLRGYISFVCQVESDLVHKLWKKYPVEMNTIFR